LLPANSWPNGAWRVLKDQGWRTQHQISGRLRTAYLGAAS